MSDTRVFTGTMSYHRMLTCAQETDPVLTYWICHYILKSLTYEERKPKSQERFMEWPHFDLKQDVTSAHFQHLINNGQIEKFCTIAFSNLTVECKFESMVRVRLEFAHWLRGLKLEFDHEHHFVTIPA